MARDSLVTLKFEDKKKVHSVISPTRTGKLDHPIRRDGLNKNDYLVILLKKLTKLKFKKFTKVKRPKHCLLEKMYAIFNLKTSFIYNIETIRTGHYYTYILKKIRK